MTHSATAGRRAAKTADGEGEADWFYGDRAVLRSPAGALPVIIEHHVDARRRLVPDVHPARRQSPAISRRRIPRRLTTRP